MLTTARWREMWKELGAANPDPRLHDELIARYSEAHRKYHTPQHLEECFEKFDDVRALAEHPAEIELALWFHDAIYNVKRHDNEKKSADWARASALDAGTPAEACVRVHSLVMATRHKAVPRGTDAEILVVDIDGTLADSSAWQLLRDPIDQSRPLPDAVTRSMGMGASPWAALSLSARSRTASARAGLGGPRLEPEEAPAL